MAALDILASVFECCTTAYIQEDIISYRDARDCVLVTYSVLVSVRNSVITQDSGNLVIVPGFAPMLAAVLGESSECVLTFFRFSRVQKSIESRFCVC